MHRWCIRKLFSKTNIKSNKKTKLLVSNIWLPLACSTMTLLVRWQEGHLRHPACKCAATTMTLNASSCKFLVPWTTHFTMWSLIGRLCLYLKVSGAGNSLVPGTCIIKFLMQETGASFWNKILKHVACTPYLQKICPIVLLCAQRLTTIIRTLKTIAVYLYRNVLTIIPVDSNLLRRPPRWLNPCTAFNCNKKYHQKYANCEFSHQITKVILQHHDLTLNSCKKLGG